jgi:ubiquinone/menaquinone biosynthesis C-methylase UbiE
MKYLEIAPNKIRGLNWDGVRDVPAPGCMVYDMRKLPMRGVMDNEYNAVYNEHFIEHLEKDEGINFFIEMLRIMKPGGIVRTVWPSMDFVDFLRSNQDLTDHPFVQGYYNFYVVKHKFAPAGNEHKSLQEQCALGLLYQNGEHKHLWYKSEMVDTLIELGYEDIKEMPYGKSGVRDFNGIDTPGQIRILHSTVLEATKPW